MLSLVTWHIHNICSLLNCGIVSKQYQFAKIYLIHSELSIYLMVQTKFYLDFIPFEMFTKEQVLFKANNLNLRPDVDQDTR